MKRKITIAIILIFIFAAISGLLYLNNVYLPVKVKNRLAKALEEKLNYNVRIEKMKYNPVRGLIAEDIAVFDKTEDKENTILKIKEVSSNILILPLFTQRKIILPLVHIDSPYLYARYQKDNTFNFQRIFQSETPKRPGGKNKFSFLIYKLNLFNGRVVFEDERFEPKLSKSVEDFGIGLNISLPKDFSYRVHARVTADKEVITKLLLEGKYDLLAKEAEAKLSLSNVVLAQYKPYLKQLPFSILSGNIESTDFTLKLKDNLLSLKGPANLKTLNLKKEGYGLSGNMIATPELSYNLKEKNLNYNLNLKLQQINLTGIPYVETINNLTGEIGYAENKIIAPNLKFRTLDSDFMLNAFLEDLSNPRLKIFLSSEQLNLGKLGSILEFIPKGIILEGKSKLSLDIDGYLKDIPANSKANFEILNAKLENNFTNIPVKEIRGKVTITSQGVKWENLSFQYLDSVYTANGKYEDFKNPLFNTTLNSKDLELVSELNTKEDVTRINRFEGKFKDSKFNLTGYLQTKEKNNPYCNLTGDFIIETSNIQSLVSTDLAKELQKFNPKGKLDIKATLAGNAKDFKNWRIALKSSAEQISIYNLKLTDFDLILEQKQGTLYVPRLDANTYSGRLTADFIYNLKDAIANYTLKFEALNVDLKKLKLDTALKNEDISGILNLRGEFTGTDKGTASIQGQAYASIKNGKLWQTKLLGGLGELFLTPEYKQIVFDKANADFVVRNGSIFTDNLTLTSEQLILQGRGSVGFDGALNLNIYSKANKELIKESPDVRKFITAIIGEITSAVSIKISGTLKEPKYSLSPIPLDIIKNIKNFILGL
ncbi:MAG: hypothetical protein DRP74_04290 [Candidatus Omnitrophota bacterium]|nr:MAG: hypothetical protein DRP74_04290 [Candidatus Omnitrophota bacterium]